LYILLAVLVLSGPVSAGWLESADDEGGVAPTTTTASPTTATAPATTTAPTTAAAPSSAGYEVSGLSVRPQGKGIILEWKNPGNVSGFILTIYRDTLAFDTPDHVKPERIVKSFSATEPAVTWTDASVPSGTWFYAVTVTTGGVEKKTLTPEHSYNLIGVTVSAPVTAQTQKPAGTVASVTQKPVPTVATQKPMATAAVATQKPAPVVAVETQRPAATVAVETQKPAPVVAVETQRPAMTVAVETQKPESVVAVETQKPAVIVTVVTQKPAPVEPVKTVAKPKKDYPYILLTVRRRHFETGDYGTAAIRFAEVADDPDCPEEVANEARLFLAKTFYEQKKYAAALKLFVRLKPVYPDEADFWISRIASKL
jgi:hypothetical protein